MRYVLALVLMFVYGIQVNACDIAPVRNTVARVVTVERAVMRLPFKVATAPFRVLSKTVTRESSSTLCAPAAPVITVIPTPMPPVKKPMEKTVEKTKETYKETIKK